MMVRLWAINKWLRYTGFRIVVEVDLRQEEPTKNGLQFFGWSGWEWF